MITGWLDLIQLGGRSSRSGSSSSQASGVRGIAHFRLGKTGTEAVVEQNAILFAGPQGIGLQ